MGGTPHRKSVYREGGTPHIFSEQGANRGGTPYILSEQGANRGRDTAHQHRLLEVIGSVRKRWAAGGWLAGWVVSSE